MNEDRKSFYFKPMTLYSFFPKSKRHKLAKKDSNISVKNKKQNINIYENSLKDGFRKNKQINSQKCLTHFLMPYSEKRNDKKGRNSNTISKIGEDYIKNNSLSFFQKALINRTSCDNYKYKKNIFNTIYNNSNEISKVANSYFKK